jgi:hypothetical protein
MTNAAPKQGVALDFTEPKERGSTIRANTAAPLKLSLELCAGAPCHAAVEAVRPASREDHKRETCHESATLDLANRTGPNPKVSPQAARRLGQLIDHRLQPRCPAAVVDAI